ncbi:MAG: zinc ribbon domain-containing protein [Kordiimonadaceae bacterium]|nr:zinc ribbon domain-containing protein [Kordiimonadaceae bacterium]
MAALENCPTCKNPTSENSTACPKCGEPLEKGWVQKVREEKAAAEAIALQQKKSKDRVRHIKWFILSFLVWAYMWGPNTYLRMFEPEQYAQKMAQEAANREDDRLLKIQELEAEVKLVPESSYSENIYLYSQLSRLDPENNNYQEKLKYYENARDAAEVALEAERRKNGYYCVEGMGGPNMDVYSTVKANLREPDSFEHVKTEMWPDEETGLLILHMRYKGRNGFGGVSIENVEAILYPADCKVISITKIDSF